MIVFGVKTIRLTVCRDKKRRTFLQRRERGDFLQRSKMVTRAPDQQTNQKRWRDQTKLSLLVTFPGLVSFSDMCRICFWTYHILEKDHLLFVFQVTDFAWSHDGRMALICYRDGFVLVGSVAGQRYWSSMLNLDGTSITCGIWSPDDQEVRGTPTLLWMVVVVVMMVLFMPACWCRWCQR